MELFKSKTIAEAILVVSFLLANVIRPVYGFDTRDVNFTLYLNVPFGSMRKLSFDSNEKSLLPSYFT